MLFSIIIPVYNVANYLPGCVDSVLENDCSNCEIILVDDGSTDGICPQLCDQLAEKHPNLIQVIHQSNRGLGGARNSGIEAARGEYLLFLDSDDSILPESLSALRGAVEKYAADIVTFRMKMIMDGSGEILPDAPSHSVPVGEVLTLKEYPSMLLDSPTTWTRIYKKSLFVESGIRFPDRLWYEDLYTTGKLLLQAKSVVGIDDCIYQYLVRSGSIMNNSNVDRNGEILLALDAVSDWYRNHGAYEAYEQEICGLALHHLCFSIARVLRLDSKHRLLKQFTDYLKKNFPNYKECKYYGTLSRQQRLVLQLVLNGQCKLAASMFKLNDMLRRR